MAQGSASSQWAGLRSRRAVRPFFGLIDSVLIEEGDFDFDGCLLREHAVAVWTWVVRDLAPDLIDPEADADDPAVPAALDALMPEIMARTRAAMAAASASPEADRRLATQLGGEAVHARLPLVLNALKCRALLGKAQAFGRATNGMADDAGLASAMQAMPLADPAVAALLFHAAVGQVANPGRLMMAAVKVAGDETEQDVVRVGFGPLIDALLGHGQGQLAFMGHSGPFVDIDLMCRAVDRFHRLSRAIGFIELTRSGRRASILGSITKTVSDRIEPRLRNVVMDINMGLRRREGTDRLDSDQILAALNGVYLLTTVKDARDSLALNALLDQLWAQVGQALEIHIDRILDHLRSNPADRILRERFDAAIRMSEQRFGAEYADVLRRARDTATR